MPLRELLATADVVSVNCTLSPASFHLIGERELAVMKATAYLINAARGPIVDEAALIRALSGRQIAGAGLDVFESEPLPSDGPLLALDNCWLAPHNANSGPESAPRVHGRTIGNLIACLHEPARRDAAHAGA